MGGDYAPDAVLEGIELVLPELNDDVELVLIGDEGEIEKFTNEKNLTRGFSVVHASQVITMSDSPTKAFGQKPQSSIAIGFYLLKEGKIDAFCSAGNTGAMLVGSLYSIKAIEGVQRPAITSLVPREDGGNSILVDVGANADCKPEVLHQFAVLGSIYSKAVYGIENPKVALLSIGHEKEKGNLVVQNTYPLLENNPNINFVGNIEGYDLFDESADVVVCDGFTGNIVLKACEAARKIMKRRNLNDDYFERWDYENYGGTPVLGVHKPVLIGHGVSSPVAIKNMIKLSHSIVEHDLVEKIKSAFQVKIA